MTLSLAVATVGLSTVLAATPAGAATTYGWTVTGTLPSWVGNGISLSCVTSGSCAGLAAVNTAVTNTSQETGMLTTSDGAETWSGAVSADANVESPGTIDCVPGTTTCVATAITNYGEEVNIDGTPEIVDYDHTLVYHSSDSGGTWSDPTTMLASTTDPSDDGMDGYSLDCVTSTTCAMVAGLGTSASYRHPGEPQAVLMGTPGSAGWTASFPFGAAAASSFELLGSVSCTSTLDCWTAGHDTTTGEPVMFSTTDGGATWSAGQIYAVSGYAYASNITCQDGTTPLGVPSTLPQYADCQMIVTDGGNGYGLNGQGAPPEILSSTDGGSTWSLSADMNSNLDGVLFKGITCPSTTVCLAYGWLDTRSGTLQGLIDVTTDGGTTWSIEEPAGTKSITGLSCVSVSECYAAGAIGAGSTGLQEPGTSSEILTTADLGLAQVNPVAPTDVTATAGVGSATVSWTASSAGYGNQPLQTYVVEAYDAANQSYAGITTVPSSQTTATFESLYAGEAYDFEVYAQDVVPENNVDVQYQSPNSAPSNTIVPTNVAEAGEGSATGTNPAPSGTLNDGSPLTATSVGSGTVTVGSYPSSPQQGLESGTTYFDVAATGSLSSVTLKACDANLSLPLQWWNSTASTWQNVSPAATLVGGCLTWTATSSSTPTVAQLYGTAFASYLVSVPDAPSIVKAKPTNGAVKVSWTAPSNDGGTAITSYKVSASPGKHTCSTTTATSCTVTGLTNATSYAFSVTATNRIGTSPSSDTVSAIPALVPGSPSHVIATAANSAAIVSWHAATSTGGSPITGYVVHATPGLSSCTSTTTSCELFGLSNGSTYHVTVSARNAVGVGPPTAAVSVRPRGVPDPPTILKVVPGSKEVTVSWSDLGSNGEPITSYTVTSSPSLKTCTTTSSSCTVKGLTNGESYTFTVRATNIVGQSDASVTSATVVPGLHGQAPISVAVSGTLKAGDTVTITATVASGVTGTISVATLFDPLCGPTVIANDHVSCQADFSAGTIKLFVTYGGSANWASHEVTHTVVIKPGQSSS